MTYIKLLEAAVEDARDVCKYLDAGKIEEAKAHTEFYWADLDKIRDMDEASKALAESRSSELQKTEQNCKTHPDAPHGFCRNASLSEDRYVCECEFWEPPQPEQEPFAWWNGEYASCYFAINRDTAGIGLKNPKAVPLYTAPPQREWVGLTDDEINFAYLKCEDLDDFARLLEAKLKEKNNADRVE
jgi:hypothetical protein